MTPKSVTEESIRHAVELLRQGQLVAFPTETVYGLGADAANPDAVAKIFAAKGRPADHPLIVHIASAAQINDWAEAVPEAALRLAEHFWPGPLTMILNKKSTVPSAVTGGQDTVGLRVPANPVALQLLQAFGGGIAAPSANRFGHISPTQAEHVAEELGDSVACILDGGPSSVGVESTIIDLSDGIPAILRPGRITRSQLKAVLQTEVRLSAQSKIRAPGMMAVHYAPNTMALLCPADTLIAMTDDLCAKGKHIGILAFSAEIAEIPCLHLLRLPADAELYEPALYSSLRALDNLQLDTILIEQPPDSEAWAAVNDRLDKATV
ncbi:Threonylcarbamoyl-AMP synthase (EC 2.7.7.87) / SUA5 domain with internal deletion [Methylomonas albis]|uniref:Threonylcarbamoyl-AMP synthase n=1 Tax=Methylomonas albis TaxID=1854563 RepID=A0ABR9D7U9_9GAMM|nr:L-threonylcarbamoyladenylate synthase [Methylomonas albis]MBD9358358.1 threonylcarbamoyl-AMP synthase [Methylomonas albis]CAD6881751.1 Threonylcarbamoyl-AMP synthase (EC 2.7.7.87) / SUA5 domain with internal deletion [Methylomonas albis]